MSGARTGLGTPSEASVATEESTASASFTDLATPGPAVTVVTGAAALVIVSAEIRNDTAGSGGRMGCAVSGASTVAASDLKSAYAVTPTNYAFGFSRVFVIDGLTPGSNNFTAKYKAVGGTIVCTNRTITVIPFDAA